ncbi:MAG: GntR family transcriptional regulator, partial [Clostridia bacterium]|nr:GntR family transcriptional regulator [Clostridia bacterium]
MLEGYRLDKSVPIPLYFQLKSMLLDEIKSGQYAVGALIPTEKELSEMFLISRTTVRQAISELVQEGWLYRVKSKGTFVARRKIQQDFIKRLETFNEQIERTGCKPSTFLLALETVELPDDIAQKLELKSGNKGIYL